MATKMTKTIEREMDVQVCGKTVIVALECGGVISFREKGTLKKNAPFVGLGQCMRLAIEETRKRNRQ